MNKNKTFTTKNMLNVFVLKECAIVHTVRSVLIFIRCN